MSEKDILDTIIAEAGGDGKPGMTAVAYTIANRAAKRGLTPTSVVKEPNQYDGYSNPGSGSRASQQNPRVRAEAKAVWDAVQSRSVPDPTNGGTDFRSGSAARSLGGNVVKVGGNTFKLGNAPTTAVAAIDAAAPEPHSFPSSLTAYADTPPVASVPLPIPRPTPPQSVPLSLTDALRAKYTSVAPSADAASSYGGILPPALQQAAPGLTSRPVQSIRIAPGDPLMGYAPPSLQDALNAKAAEMAQQRTVAPPGVLTASSSAGVGASRNALIPSFAPQQNSGAIKTVGQAGQVALPPGVVPASVTRDLAAISALQRNSSGSPDERGPQPVYTPPVAPTPMPGRPAGLNPPYIPGPNGSNLANKDTSSLPSGVTDSMAYGPSVKVPETGPVRAIQQVTAQPTTKQIVNPAYTNWMASQTQPLKAGQAYTAGGNVVTQAQQNAFGGLSSIPKPPPIPVRTPAPSKYITVQVPGSAPQVPLPRPRPAPPVANTGGLLGLLFPGTNPSALTAMGQGFGGAPSVAAPAVGAQFLADRGVNTSGLTIGQQANELNKQLAGSSRNADGSRGFS